MPFEGYFSITTWNVDFAKGLDLRPEAATPENLLAVEHSSNVRRKNSGEEPIEEASALEVNGVKGNFFRAKYGENKSQIMMGWYTYRYYKNNAQKINITVICSKNDLQKSMQIIQSIKFQ